MRKLINATYISLDGVIERPHEWPSTGDRGSEGDEVQTELADAKPLQNGIVILSYRFVGAA